MAGASQYALLPEEDDDAALSQVSAQHALPGGGTFTRHSDGKGYSYAYGPKGLAGLRQNYYTAGCAVFASIGGLTFGYDQGVIANVLVMKDFVARFPVSPFQQGLMTAVLELGALSGALGAGILADKFSRRHAIALACVVFCIGSAIQCLAGSLNHLIVGRAIGGVGIGALSMLSPLYMSEISPPELRGSLIAIEQFAIVLGVVVGFWIGFLTRSIPGAASWRIPLAIQIGPGLMLGLGCLFLPPSPRLLVLHNKNDAALRSLAELRGRVGREDDTLLQIEYTEMRIEATLVREREERNGSKDGSVKSWLRLFQADYRSRTLVGVGIMFFQQWSGINALLYYGPSLMKSIGLEGDTIKLVGSGFVSIVQYLAVIPAILYIDRWGRKPLLIYGATIMAASHAIIAILVLYVDGDWAKHRTLAWTAVGCVYVFTAAYGLSIGPIAWILSNEVFPLSVRSKGVALSVGSNWLNNFLIGLVTPMMLDASPFLTYTAFASACAWAALWTKNSVPETKDRSLEEMDELFSSSVGAQDAALKEEIEERFGLHQLVHDITSE